MTWEVWCETPSGEHFIWATHSGDSDAESRATEDWKRAQKTGYKSNRYALVQVNYDAIFPKPRTNWGTILTVEEAG